MTIFVENSSNRKINGTGKISSTYGSIKATCGPCSLKDNGCYAQTGLTNIHTRRADRLAEGMTPLQAAREEKRLIQKAFKGGVIPQDGSKGGRDLRLHVAGDARTVGAAKQLAIAAKNWEDRKGGAVFSYTHAHAKVLRDHWGAVSVLASVETGEEAEEAKLQGYAPAIVVDVHPKGAKVFTVDGSNTSFIPCPQQTMKAAGCTDCRLCMNDGRLKELNMGIAFALHGSGTKKGKEMLKRKLKVL